jgi:PAS domain S-box-containing protein
MGELEKMAASGVSRLLEELDVAVGVLDQEGRIVSISPAIERITGYSPEELIGRTPWTIMPQEGGAMIQEQFERKLRGEVQLTVYEVMGRHKHGTPVPLQVCSEPLVEGGRIVGTRGIVHVAGDRAALPGESASRVSLTPRQLAVLRLLAEGLSTRAIADELSISPETARNHIRRILIELGCHSRLEAVVVGRRIGLLD